LNTIFDFAESHRDISFSASDFNEIDNVIFSRLSYLDFKEHTGKTLKAVSESFVYTPEEELNKRNKNLVKTEDLLKLLGSTKRYASVVVTDITESPEKSTTTAFSATVFKLTESTSYIAYRGTDEKIVGFYEDAELAYSFPIVAQLAALSYTNKILSEQSGNFIIGGHSKGGNLAMFSYIFTNEENKARIPTVYNNDGPGFPKDLVNILFTPQTAEKIINILPDSSIVGRMLEAGGKRVIIKSSAIGASQHNVFTWLINGEEFEKAEKFSALSEYMDSTLTESLDTISQNGLQKAVKAIYDIAKQSGIYTLDDINKKNYIFILLAIIQAVKSTDNAGSEVGEIIKALAKSLLNSIDIKLLLNEFDFETIKALIEAKKKEDA